MKDKEQAKFDYLKMIGQSWTWAKITAEEKAKFLEILEHPCSGAVIKGNYDQRWEACEALYHTYLEGLGYDPLEWREAQPTVSTFYELNYKTHGQQVKPLQMTNKVQAKRLAKAATTMSGNTEVSLTKVDLVTTKVRLD
jgi:hypothetical protein